MDYKTHVTEDGRNFLDLNPLGYAPFLELKDGSLLREGPAILQYLADLSPIAASSVIWVHGVLLASRLAQFFYF
ncbi:glutathione S-transferase N-terminal domain-containing protein [Comamonas testosteroni]|uniref:glutathione S-transferase N-terminal domain-containing protein n=1 Tax=Comamonas testosteroni TaxID=285 RepID=UPI001E417EA2|nr:glutathione S-transferase N-terminal domain-containing protein [Comamonas testosteroni]